MSQPETATGINGRAAESVSAYEAADRLLRIAPSDISPLGWRFRLQAAKRLEQRFEKELRGGREPFTTEAAALAVLKGAGRELRKAAAALLAAAERLREKGDGFGANRAFMASRETDAAADGIDPN